MPAHPPTSALSSDSLVTTGLSEALTATPLFYAAVLFALGIAAANWFWLRPSLVLVSLALACACCAWAAVCALRIAWLPLAILWLLLGAWCAEMEPHPAPAPVLAALSDGLLRTVEGTVVDAGPIRGEIEQELNEGDSSDAAEAETGLQPTQRIDLRVSSVEVVTDSSDAQSPVAGGVRLTVRWPAGAAAAQPLHCGDRVRAVVRLREPEIYHDPGVWSRQDFL